MADGRNQLPRFLAVLIIMSFRGVTSNINDGNNDGNNVKSVDPLYSLLAYNQFPESYGYAPLYPIENHLWRSPENLGEVSGVAVDPSGYLMIFHRGDRTWNVNTFDANARYQEKYRGSIQENTVLKLDPETGNIINGWGNATFYLPHGIYVDSFANVWLTDIALHQVFKYSASGVLKLILGRRFKPGSGSEQFCQPTSVVVIPNGEIVVADGYCNSRIIIFDPRGNPKRSIETVTPLRIPHALTVLPNENVCIADRENARIMCLDVTKNFKLYWICNPEIGRIFGIASYDGFIYTANEMTSRNAKIKGSIIDPVNRRVRGFWGPESSSFVRPHAIAVSPQGTALFVSEIGPNKVWKFDLMRI